MKVLVTGGAGFIGSHVCENLLENGQEVFILDDLSTGKLSNISAIKDNVTFIHSRVEDYDFGSLTSINAVIHLAAQASVPLSITEFYNSSKTNILSSLKIIDFCIKYKLPLVYASSSAIYGGLPLGDDEEDSVDLLSPYAADKFALELYAKVSSVTSGLSSIGLRFFNVYGPRQDPSNPYSGVISIFIEKLLSNQNIIINGGSQTRDFVHVTNVAEVIAQAVYTTSSKTISDSVNVLTGKSVSIDSLADNLIEITGSCSEKIYHELPVGDPMESNGTVAKLPHLLNIMPSDFISLHQGLKTTVNDMKNASKNL
jgi:UDP-glucose 4-epimerase